MKSKVLVIMAHPDDAEILCLGTLLKYKSLGYEVKVLVVSTGEHGISVEDKQNNDKIKLASDLRYEESKNAFFGSGIELDSLHQEDGAIQLTKELISKIETQIKSFQPDILITHWISGNGFDHQDHSVIGQACLNASQRSASIKTFMHAEPLQQTKCGFVPNFFMNISNFFEAKISALTKHESQKGRIYLSESFHRHRCRNNSLLAGRNYFEADFLFESFNVQFEIEL